MMTGQLRKVIMQSSKNGFFYVLDRTTGQFISARPFAYITWATGVDSGTGRPIEATGTLARYGSKGTFISPNNEGAHNWPTMSFNSDTGLAYIPAGNGTFFYQEDPAHFVYQPGLIDRGLSLDPARPSFEQTLIPPPSDRPSGSFLLAWDSAAQKEAWRVPGVGGSTMTTAGNLVFSSTGDGEFVAFSADKGEKLSQVQLEPGFGSPVTYMIDGKQYVSVLAGRSGNGRLYTFALDAHSALPKSLSPAANNGVTTLDGVYRSDQAARGEEEYLEKCASCHQTDLMGQNAAPPLVGSPFRRAWAGRTVGELLSVIAQTVPQGDPNSLSQETYADLVSYILQANGLPPGPHELKGDLEVLKRIAIEF
jgi:quinohemoprotein ethanol dehydrogenase